MSTEEHQLQSAIETARLELDRAHRGVLAMEAGEVRRGLELALLALADMPDPADGPDLPVGESVAKLKQALIDLDAGALAEMDSLIEQVRKALE